MTGTDPARDTAFLIRKYLVKHFQTQLHQAEGGRGVVAEARGPNTVCVHQIVATSIEENIRIGVVTQNSLICPPHRNYATQLVKILDILESAFVFLRQ